MHYNAHIVVLDGMFSVLVKKNQYLSAYFEVKENRVVRRLAETGMCWIIKKKYWH